MPKRDEYGDESLKHVQAIRAFRHKGKPVKKGKVFAKADFDSKFTWLNRVHMQNPCVVECGPKGVKGVSGGDDGESGDDGNSGMFKMPGMGGKSDG